MNAALAPEDSEPIPEGILLRAGATARGSGRSVVSTLEDMLADDPARFIRRLGRTLAFPVLGMAELRGLSPAFDRLTFADCMRRSCIATTVSGKSIAIICDPFDIDQIVAQRPQSRDRHQRVGEILLFLAGKSGRRQRGRISLVLLRRGARPAAGLVISTR